MDVIIDDTWQEEVSHIREAEPTAAKMVLVTLMKPSRVIVVCPGIWQIIGYG